METDIDPTLLPHVIRLECLDETASLGHNDLDRNFPLRVHHRDLPDM